MVQSTSAIIGGCGSVSAELATGPLGDQRLNGRRDRLIAVLEQQPDRGFPDACADGAELEALYRFLRNPRVTPEAILAPHLAASAARCAALGDVLVVHDTTDMVFAGEGTRAGLTRLGPGRHGFWVHAALAVAADGTRAPLGLLALMSFGRSTLGPEPRPPKKDHERFRDPTKESRYWADSVASVRTRVGPTAKVIHLMDRGADSYELFATWLAQHDRFIVRLTHDRRILSTSGRKARLSEAVGQATTVWAREVPLAPRRDGRRTLSARTLHPARDGRMASLHVSATRVHLIRPQHVRGDAPPTLDVHVVAVDEVHAPAGTEPVSWRLVTTEPIETAEQILRVVDWYRTRWLIEEYFKALKTGCAYEKRQLESLQTLRVALALFAPIAWRLLLLRYLSREHPTTPATVALTAQQVQVLRMAPAGATLPVEPTVVEALQAVARLGGHLRQNGPPGWLVLARGYQKLCDREAGWLAATACRALTSDQS